MTITIPRFDKANVLVVGDVMLDRYWHGATSRISPEAPVPVVRIERHEDRPGGAANVALNVASLGAHVSLLGIIGADEAGAELERQLGAAHIRCALVKADSDPTIVKLRILSQHQQLIRLDSEKRFSATNGKALMERFASLIGDVSVVVLSDYDKGTLSDVQSLIAAAKDKGRLVLVDPKDANFDKYRGATLIKPNLKEFEMVVGPWASEPEFVGKARALLERLDIGALLITRGEHGMTLLQRGAEPRYFPVSAREVYDVTGAGDTVIATLGAALAVGESMPDAVALSNIAAGIVVAKLGTATVSGHELRQAVRRMEGSAPHLARDQALSAIADARAAGEKIVFTNGCFDILHAGHVTYLAQAKALGDRLVLGVNGDASVKRLKGEGRPINTLANRVAVLEALSAVDWVVPFEEDTPEALLREIRPDVLVKGGDYGVEGVVGGDIVRAYGGDVRVLTHVEGLSTTGTIAAINASSS